MTDSVQVSGLSRLINKNSSRPDAYKIEQEFLGTTNIDNETQRKIQEEINAISSRLGLTDNKSNIEPEDEDARPVDYEHDMSSQNMQSQNMHHDMQSQSMHHDMQSQNMHSQNMQHDMSSQNMISQNMHQQNNPYKTAEQFKRERISAVVSDIDEETDYGFENERKEDIKNSMLEQIDFLRTTLESEEMDISRIPSVTHSSSFTDIENTLKILKFKYDRVRYSTLADEILMIGAYGLEELFDGQRVWFNKYRPDLTGWHKKLRTKLRRMRHNTSSIVGQFVHEYNIGPMLSTLMEIVPNMIQHSFENSRRKDSENKYEEDMRNATEAIRDIGKK